MIKLKIKKETKIILPLFVSAVILMFLNTGDVTHGQEGCFCDENIYFNSDTLYEKVDCAQCNCSDSGKKLLRFHGKDSNCEEYATETERVTCYSKFSQASYECENLSQCDRLGGTAREECYQKCKDKYPGPAFNYYHGGAGTLVTTKDIDINGARTYFVGFDNNGEHKILTGFTGLGSEAVILRQTSRDVELGSLSALADDLTFESPYAGIYFAAKPGYDSYRTEYLRETALGGNLEALTIHNMEDVYRGTGILKSAYMDNENSLLFSANSQNILRIDNTAKQSGGFEEPLRFVTAEKGVEVDSRNLQYRYYTPDARSYDALPSYVSADEIVLNGKRTYWTPVFIEGAFRLYIK